MLRSSPATAVGVPEMMGLLRGKPPRVLALFLLALVVGLSGMVVAARPAHAVSTFSVNFTADTDDGRCTRLIPTTSSECTLREAMNAANSNANAAETDLIRFSIPGNGPHTISPSSALPTISQSVTIDGYTEGDATATTDDDAKENILAKGTKAVLKIELDGTNAGSANGLNIVNAPAVVVRGLVINNWANRGIEIFGEGASGARIEGNFIGTDVSGSFDQGNRLAGAEVVGASGVTIGGTTPDKRNLISANGNASNPGSGVFIRGDLSTGTKVEGNLIGTDSDGTVNLGNAGIGVVVGSAAHSVVGTQAAGSNVIAFNGLDGVTVLGDSSTGNRILRNSIFSNGGLGIDLQGGTETASGATANDGGTADDADTGANGLQNKPKLTSAVTITSDGTSTTTIEGVLDTKPNQTFTVQFFSNSSGNEGKKFIGQKQVPTDADGKVTFSFSPNNAVRAGNKITATATGPEGTSEFSAPREVTVS
jgi:CSLREA domain-containing protein